MGCGMDSRGRVETQGSIRRTSAVRSKVSHQSLRDLIENIGNKISDIACSNILSDISPQTRETKEKINKRDYMKLKCFCTAKENINKIKIQPLNGRI